MRFVEYPSSGGAAGCLYSRLWSLRDCLFLMLSVPDLDSGCALALAASTLADFSFFHLQDFVVDCTHIFVILSITWPAKQTKKRQHAASLDWWLGLIQHCHAYTLDALKLASQPAPSPAPSSTGVVYSSGPLAEESFARPRWLASLSWTSPLLSCSCNLASLVYLLLAGFYSSHWLHLWRFELLDSKSCVSSDFEYSHLVAPDSLLATLCQSSWLVTSDQPGLLETVLGLQHLSNHLFAVVDVVKFINFAVISRQRHWSRKHVRSGWKSCGADFELDLQPLMLKSPSRMVLHYRGALLLTCLFSG